MALAIIDDLGAIIVIAVFYGSAIKWVFLLAGAFVYGMLWACSLLKIKPCIIQLILGIVLWYLVFNSGIEASISGVLVAFAMPVNCIPKLEKIIHKAVNFVILPLFALANTAVLIPGDILGALKNTISVGVITGLVIGKPVGIFLFSRIMIGLKIASLPLNTNLKQLLGMGSLAGIGFTMSIFTATLAFESDGYRDIAKIAILASLALSMVISSVYFLVVEQKFNIKPMIPHHQVHPPGLAVG